MLLACTLHKSHMHSRYSLHQRRLFPRNRDFSWWLVRGFMLVSLLSPLVLAIFLTQYHMVMLMRTTMTGVMQTYSTALVHGAQSTAILARLTSVGFGRPTSHLRPCEGGILSIRRLWLVFCANPSNEAFPCEFVSSVRTPSPVFETLRC